ncbi:cellulose binding domain-containing protein, partial [Catellatospora sp. KI3]|uniref:cellulose binding domain-containing protein n=1 Tax=Catellatospora sp. KI3 TaxID=3041620 RepID=UPI0024832B33
MHPRRRRTALLAAAAALLSALTAGALLAAPAAQAASGCQVSYTVASQWPGGFSANVGITNLGSAINGWTLNWTFTAGQTITQSWGFTASPASGTVTARNVDYTAAIPTNGTVSVGFNGGWNNTANPVPTSFTLNGTACTGSVSSPAPSATRSTAPSPSRSATPSPSANPGQVPA